MHAHIAESGPFLWKVHIWKYQISNSTLQRGSHERVRETEAASLATEEGMKRRRAAREKTGVKLRQESLVRA